MAGGCVRMLLQTCSLPIHVPHTSYIVYLPSWKQWTCYSLMGEDAPQWRLIPTLSSRLFMKLTELALKLDLEPPNRQTPGRPASHPLTCQFHAEMIVKYRKWQGEGHTALTFNQTSRGHISDKALINSTNLSKTAAQWLLFWKQQKQWRASRKAASPPLMMLSLVKTTYHITRVKLPSVEDFHTSRWGKKANGITRDPKPLRLLQSATRCWSIWSCSTRLRDTVYLQAIIPELCSSLLPLCLCATLFHVCISTSCWIHTLNVCVCRSSLFSAADRWPCLERRSTLILYGLPCFCWTEFRFEQQTMSHTVQTARP